MDTELTRPGASTRLKRELSRDAINLAISGEWERAAEMNRAILELYSDDVEAMNRLARALTGMFIASAYSISSRRLIPQSRMGPITFKFGARAATPNSMRTWSLPLPVQPWATAKAPSARAASTI